MSHSAHRLGTKEEFSKDYVLFVKPARGIDDVDEETKAETIRKTKELADIAIKYNPVNMGRSKVGCIEGGVDYHEIADSSLNGFMTVFKEKNKIVELLKAFKEKDYEFSIVASGLTEDYFDICKTVGLKPHTVLFTVGIWGKTELLSSEDHLKITTLCGHHMVSSLQVDHYVEEIKNGSITAEEAAKKMVKPCTCGIFNTSKTADVLKKMACFYSIR